jgi:hypothetical protein
LTLNRAAIPNNLGIVAVDTVVLRILFPIAAVGMALLAEQRGWGLMHALAAPAWMGGSRSWGCQRSAL